MAFLWTEELSVGVGKIDQQHQEIFAKYDNFLSACKSGKGREEIFALLNFLGSYIKTHFAEEEQLMKEYSYPEMQKHLQQHQHLTEVIETFLKTFEEQGPSISLITEVNYSLRDWLVVHIKKVDMEFGSFLNQKWGLF